MSGTAEERAIAALLDRPLRIYVAASGAGAGIQQRLWRVPGVSAILAGASFPYAPDATAGLLGFRPERFVGEEAALDLAMAAYYRASDPSRPHLPAVGLGLTATVASLRERRGGHRVHAAVMTDHRVLAASLTLQPACGAEARELDGVTADDLGMMVLLTALTDDATRLLPADERARARFFERPLFTPDGRRLRPSDLAPDLPIFPGAFDPVHEGHDGIADRMRLSGYLAPAFAICADPPHKGALSAQEMLRRAKAMHGRTLLFSEGDPLYLDKARRMPGRTFVVGADALIRMLDPRWGDTSAMLDEFRALRTRFAVFGRRIDGVDVPSVEAIARVPEGHRQLFESFAGEWAISSTERRRTAQR